MIGQAGSASDSNVLPPAAEIKAADFLGGVAQSIGQVATLTGSNGCPRATKLAVAFYNGLAVSAPDACPAFAAAIGAYVSLPRLQLAPSPFATDTLAPVGSCRCVAAHVMHIRVPTSAAAGDAFSK